jgi:microcompartment protein CcmL/EutN
VSRPRPEGPSLAALETSTVARGVVVLDQMLKRADVEILAHRTLSPGRYLILVAGGEAEVEEAVDAGARAIGEDRVDGVTLWAPHRELAAALGLADPPSPAPPRDALALVETTTVCAALHAADRCLKELDTHLLELRLGAGLSGKGAFTHTGPLDAVEACVALLEGLLGPRLIRVEVIPQPHDDLPRALLEAEPPLPRAPSPSSGEA